MRHASLVVVSTLSTLLLACGSDSTPSPQPPTPEPAPPSVSPGPGPVPTVPQASLRLLHASANAPMVDVWIKGETQPLLKNATFGAATGYVNVPAGKVELELRASPSRSTDAVAFTSPAIDLAAGTKTTAIAAGQLDATDKSQAFRILPMVDGFKTAPDKITVRVVNGAPDAPALGLDIGDDNAAKPEIPATARFAESGADGVQITADRPLQIGVIAGGARITAFTTPTLPLGSELYVVATGFVARHPRANDGFSLLTVSATASYGLARQNPVIYSLHTAPDVPVVDLFAGEVELADNLGFGQLSAPIQVRPGRYDVDFFPHANGNVRPQGAPVASRSSSILVAGQRYLAVATGFIAGAAPSFELSAYSDEKAYDDAANARLRAVHAAPDAPTVDIGVATSGGLSPVLIPALAFLGSSPSVGLSVAPGSYTLGVTPAGQSASIVARFPVTLNAGARSFAIAAGVLDATKGPAFRLLAIDTAVNPWTIASVAPL